MKCPIGTYCSGGCYISSKLNISRQCEEEKNNFDYFIKKLIIPQINERMAKMNIINSDDLTIQSDLSDFKSPLKITKYIT